jgi:hypothetical protein
MSWLGLIAGIIFEAFVALLALKILYLIWWEKMPLHKLLSEQNGDASLSRLQFLIFTLVISMSLFLIIVNSEPLKFPHIPPEIFGLLGISASSYLVSKGIQFSNPAGVMKPALSLAPNALSAPVLGGPMAPTTFVATVVNASPGTVMPSITWSLDAPALGGLTPQPPNSAVYSPATVAGGNVTVTIRAQAAGFDDGIAVVTY